MVEIGGKPILWHIMQSYAHYGHNDFYIALGYKAETIKEYFLTFSATKRGRKYSKNACIWYSLPRWEGVGPSGP